MSATPDGSPSVHILPANRSYVIADSLYKDPSAKNESAFGFTSYLNAALIGKDIVYSKLYWNQALFSHKNDNCEIRFQINGDTSKTYIVYVTPYLMFNQFDGNPEGSSFLTPQLYSYASNVEIGLKTDVRSLPENYTLINSGSGVLKDANGNTMHPEFRYSPSRGFVFTFSPSSNNNIPVYTIRLLPCSFIEKAHFVHGFGIITPSSDGKYVPRDEWTPAYFSDDTPTLLPFRYITITSNELTKDRRLTSFQNSNATKSLNELAIFDLNCSYTGSYHTKVVGNDGTVISKRESYNPQSFFIEITDENGRALQADDPIRALLTSGPPVADVTKYSFLINSPSNQQNRGNKNFMNYLLFGQSEPSNGGEYLPPVTSIEYSTKYPFGNPQADGLDEDLIHELVTVLKYN